MNNLPSTVTNDNDVDNHVDEEIIASIMEKKNFFMFAGAGSGKTRSLVNALEFIEGEYGEQLRVQFKQVAVMTYTNAACDEIMRRVGYNSLFAVSTIHSFLWELIKPYQRDIKLWIKAKLETDIAELQVKQDYPRRRTADYSDDIVKKKNRLANLDNVSRFTYNPNGENVGRDSLDHSEVISMGSSFIRNRATMQKVMVNKFPILFIDESQDTKKELIDALWEVEKVHSDDFIIGMFGDTMQKIYMDGKENLSQIVPDCWAKPAKKMNHRSNKRIIQFANSIRATIDKQSQQPRSDKSEGFVRLFIVPAIASKDEVENQVYSKMAEITSDEKWKEQKERRVLVLEHSMAASRIGFEILNRELAKVFDQSFRDGTLTELSFLMKVVYPLIQAKESKNEFAVMKILREHSPVLKGKNFTEPTNQLKLLNTINESVNGIVSLWNDGVTPKCVDVYKKLKEVKLFDLPKRIEEMLGDETEVSDRIVALRVGLDVSFSELQNYWDYITDNTQFSTHQGIKGLEFDRVAVIMDDENAGGSLFSYEKLFGAKDLTDTDRKNEKEGKDNSISRTMRLFYVTCTRAIESLVLIAYTSNVEAVRQTVKSKGWLDDSEIMILDKNL